jgi:hypothetical protein
MNNHKYRETMHTEHVVINDTINMSLDEIEMVCRWLIYRGRENDMPKNSLHIRFRTESPELTPIAHRLLGRYGECDDMKRTILRDVYPQIMDYRRRVQRI